MPAELKSFILVCVLAVVLFILALLTPKQDQNPPMA
jgi:hypothetical protein